MVVIACTNARYEKMHLETLQTTNHVAAALHAILAGHVVNFIGWTSAASNKSEDSKVRVQYVGPPNTR